MIRQFTSNEFLFLLYAVRWTLLLSLIAFVGGGIAGLFVALARTSDLPWLRRLAAGYIQVFQGTPLLMQLFLVFLGASILGGSIDPLVAGALGPSVNPPAFSGGMWPGSMPAIPKGQWGASTPPGLPYP